MKTAARRQASAAIPTLDVPKAVIGLGNRSFQVKELKSKVLAGGDAIRIGDTDLAFELRQE